MNFTEKQKFTQTWLWIVMILPVIFFLIIAGFAINEQLIKGKPFGNHPMSDTGLIFFLFSVLLFFILITCLFFIINLKVIIDKDEIRLKFFPFHLSWRKYPWSSIERYEIITYHPIADYGGWGIRFGKKGKAFNVKGNEGLLLHFRNGKQLLIGTQKASELRDYLKILLPGHLS